MQTLKNLFTLPGVLLLLAIVVFNAAIPNSGLDFHVHDTYYAFSSGSCFGNPFLLGMDSLLLISWLFHALLRFRQALSSRGRWIHLVITLICLIVFCCFPNRTVPWPRTELTFQEIDQYYLNNLLSTYGILGLILSQLLFWIIAIICLIVNRPLMPKDDHFK